MLKNRNIPLVISFSLIFISYMLMALMPLGVADGGSLYKVLERLGLMYGSTPSAEYFSTFYMFKNGLPFDVRILSFIYFVFLAVAVTTLTRGICRRMDENLNKLFAFLIGIVFADFCYMLYLNTFYREAAIYVYLLLAVAACVIVCKRRIVQAWVIVQFLASVSLLAFLGYDTAIIAIILSIGFIMLCINSHDGRITGIISGVVALTVAVSALMFITPTNYKRDLYSSVFLGVAQTESVEKLGLPAELNELKNTFYSEETENKYMLEEKLYSKISYVDIIGFYLENPTSLFNAVKLSAANGFNVRPSYLGNFSHSHPGAQANYFAGYSFLKNKFVPNTLPFVLFMYVLYFGVLIYIHKTEEDKRRVATSMIMLGIASVFAFLMPFVLSGTLELGRSMFMFNVLFDLMLVLSVIAGTRYMLERRRKIREKFGATQ